MSDDASSLVSLGSRSIDFEPAASQISDQSPAPPWLKEHLMDWAPSLMLHRVVLTRQPTRATVIKRAREMLAATKTLGETVADNAMREFLTSPPSGALDEATCQRVLTDLSQRARGVLQNPDLVTPDGKARPGRSRAILSDVSSARDDCAAIIAEAWCFCRGDLPGSQNPKAAEAAQTLWEASGAQSAGWGTSRLPGWRIHFENIRSPDHAAYRQELRRHLTESKRQADLLQL